MECYYYFVRCSQNVPYVMAIGPSGFYLFSNNTKTGSKSLTSYNHTANGCSANVSFQAVVKSDRAGPKEE